MKTGFSEAPAAFQSASQTARVDTEAWAKAEMFCPNCEHNQLSQFPANKPVADFYCKNCGDEFELKSQSKNFSRKVADGAYFTKMERLAANNSPNLILLHYDRTDRQVKNLSVVPRFFFVPSIIERRKPLAPTARRAGWVGSNILLDRIPMSGRITIIKDGLVRDRDCVVEEWNRLRFIDRQTVEARGWLLDVMHCVENIGTRRFTLSDVYAFEAYLSSIYPQNRNVRPKIRQQLQVLRDNGYLSFLGHGHYERSEF